MTTNTASNNDPASVVAPCLDIFDALEPHALVERYRAGVQALEPRVLELSDQQADRQFTSDDGLGLWSCRTLLTHLMDAELLFTTRLRRILVEDGPIFENWDEHAFIDSRLCQPGESSLLMPVGAIVAAIHTIRQTLATVLVQLQPEDWQRRAMTPYQGEVTFLEILRYATFHIEHHAAFMNAKVNAILGPAEDSTVNSGSGGCGEGCSCVKENQA